MATKPINENKVLVLSGAGVSAESGLQTFRDADGLWHNHAISDVATPEGWRRDPQLVLEFYNERRRQAAQALPNPAHLAIAKLEQKFDVAQSSRQERRVVVQHRRDRLAPSRGSSIAVFW